MLALALIASVLLVATPANATFPGTNSSLYVVEYDDSGSGGIPRYNADGTYSGSSVRCADAGSGLTVNSQSRLWAGESYYGPGTFISCIESNGDSGVYFISADFSDAVEVTFFGGSHKDPAISEDGNRMLYASRPTPDSGYSVCLLRLDQGGSAQPTCFDGGANSDDWAPGWNPSDPQQFAFVSTNDGDADIWLHDLGSNSAGPLTENAVNDFGPDYAPDGSRLLYSSQVEGRDQLFAMRPADREPIQITSDANNNFEPAVSPDSNYVAFTKQGTAPGSRPRVYLMSFSTREEVPLQGQLENSSYDHPEWFQAGGGGCDPKCEPPTENRGFATFKLVQHLKAKGQIFSEPMGSPECTNGVAVKIQRRKSGRWVAVAGTRTKMDGYFIVGLPDKPGTYRAKMGRVEAGEPDFPVVCGAATSPTKKHSH